MPKRHKPQRRRSTALRDGEADGQPSTDADGDGADEDGVTFGSIRVGQLDAGVIVNVQNAPAGAKLDVWIDFNGDGNWGGPAERIAENVIGCWSAFSNVLGDCGGGRTGDPEVSVC